MNTYKVKLKDADGNKDYVEVEANNKREAEHLAQDERGAGWLAVEVKVIK